MSREAIEASTSTSSSSAQRTAANTALNAITSSSSTRALKYKPFRQRGAFIKDLGPMMFGFGDSSPSSPDTLILMEQLLIDHITSVCLSAQKSSSNPDKLKLEDVKFALRNDPKKLSRVEELLFMTEVIARARGRDDLEQYADEPTKNVGGKGDDEPTVAVQVPVATPVVGNVRNREQTAPDGDSKKSDREEPSPKKKKKKKSSSGSGKKDKGKEKEV